MVNCKKYHGLRVIYFKIVLGKYMLEYGKKHPTDEIFDEFYDNHKFVL